VFPCPPCRFFFRFGFLHRLGQGQGDLLADLRRLQLGGELLDALGQGFELILDG
jgi:hypothetical protein